MILTTEPKRKATLAQLLKNLFDNDNLGNAFNTELSKILLSIDETKISSDLLSFYKKILSIKTFQIQKLNLTIK